MRRLGGFVVLLVLFACATDTAWSQGTKAKPKTTGDKLPVPDHAIPMDLSAWRQNLVIKKMTYNKDDNQVVFLVQAKKNFAFTDDGYDAPFEFLDEDGVSMTQAKNLKWDKVPKDLRFGELTRVYLELPDDEILDKAKKARAVVKGFFNKGK
jgi:hypothetical protein